jgi:hypothetical protein
MSVGKLLLRPESVEPPPPSRGRLIAAMQGLGLIGSPVDKHRRPRRFLAGQRFLQLISFLGCSPNVRLQPPTDRSEDFCYIEVLGPWEQARFMHGRNTRPPGCPVCGHRNADWQASMQREGAEASRVEWTCGACGARTPPSQWNWRQQAGFGRLFIQINSIFPSEAVPTPELLESLERLSATPWRYFYIQG